MNEDNATYSRRTFLKSSTAATAFVALGGGLALDSGVFAKAAPVAARGAKQTVYGFCDGCLYKKCKSKYQIQDGIVLNVEGAEDGIYNVGTMCQRGQAQVVGLYDPYRVKRPLKRTNPEKGLHVDPGWVEISWEEALSTTARKIKEVVEKDPREFIVFGGFGAYHSLYIRPFAAALGTPNALFSPGAFCSAHSASEILHGSFLEAADPKHCGYKIEIGRGMLCSGAADGESLAEANAVSKGMKIIKVDPRCSTLFRNSEWVPIKPQTDLAFLLAMEHVIIWELNTFDKEFIQQRTNAGYLIGPDGQYVRNKTTNKPYVWDLNSKSPAPFDNASAVCALEGTYTVDGVTARPAFALIKESIASYTPEWQEALTTIPAAKVRQLAKDFVENARIGSTIEIDGVTFPYRPAAIAIYKGLTNHQNGHLGYFVAMTLNILVGAFDVPGGNLGHNHQKYAKDDDWHPKIFYLGPPNKIKFPPTDGMHLPNLIPLAHDVGYQFSNSMTDLKRHWIDYVPKAAISYGCNLFSKGGSEELVSAGLRKIGFMATISLVFDEHTAFADIVLPQAHNMEEIFCYERPFDRPAKQEIANGPMGARKALTKPLYDGRQADSILIDLAQRLGLLAKTHGIAKNMNNIRSDFPMNTTNIKDVYDAWIKGKYGNTWNFDKVAEVGQISVPPLKESAIYAYSYAPGNQIKLPIYNIFLLNAKNSMLSQLRAHGASHPAGDDAIENVFQPIPKWHRPPEFTKAGENYDLNLIGWRAPQFSFDVNNAIGNVVLQEIAARHPLYGKLVINPVTAAKKGLKSGDIVYVENKYNSKIGPVPVVLSESIHPDAVGVSGGQARKTFNMGPANNAGRVSWNRMASIDWKAIDPVAGAIEISPAVRITKA